VIYPNGEGPWNIEHIHSALLAQMATANFMPSPAADNLCQKLAQLRAEQGTPCLEPLWQQLRAVAVAQPIVVADMAPSGQAAPVAIPLPDMGAMPGNQAAPRPSL